MFVRTLSSLRSHIPRLSGANWPRRRKTWTIDQGSTVRGCGSDTSGTTGVSCMDGSYLSQGTAQRARRRERAAYFGSNRRGAVACFGVPAGLRRHRHSLADAPLAAKGPPVVGVRFPVARRRRVRHILRMPSIAPILRESLRRQSFQKRFQSLES